MLLRKTISIFIGSILQSIGINLFLLPVNLLDGGIIGLSLIAYYVFGIKVGFGAIVLNIPIYILAWFRSKKYFFNSLHGMLVSNFCIDVCSPISFHFIKLLHLSPYLNSVIGGCLVGIGVGIMLRCGISTDGSELLAQFLSRKISINIGVLILLMDFLIVLLGELVNSSSNFLLSLMTIICIGLTTSLSTVGRAYLKTE